MEYLDEYRQSGRTATTGSKKKFQVSLSLVVSLPFAVLLEVTSEMLPSTQKLPLPSESKKAKRTAAGIPTWSPTVVLISRLRA